MKTLFIACGVGFVVSSLEAHPADEWQVRYRTPPAASALNGVAYGNGRFVAVGLPYALNPSIFTSSDGMDWVSQAQGTWSCRAIAFGNARFVAVSSDHPPAVLISTNGAN